MQVVESKKYKKVDKHVHKVFDVGVASREFKLLTPKQKDKFIKTIVVLTRSSKEYKDYIAYLKKYVDMTCCSFFQKINTSSSRKVRIEIHHEPFTIYDLAAIVVDAWSDQGRELNHLNIAEEVMRLHYQGLVGLIPLSLTVHQLVHDGKVFIPLQYVYGDVLEFVKNYEKHINDDYMSMLEAKLELSKKLQDNSILETSYMYIEVDGVKLPSPIQK